MVDSLGGCKGGVPGSLSLYKIHVVDECTLHRITSVKVSSLLLKNIHSLNNETMALPRQKDGSEVHSQILFVQLFKYISQKTDESKSFMESN